MPKMAAKLTKIFFKMMGKKQKIFCMVQKEFTTLNRKIASTIIYQH
jgi:hypothetical protein